LRYWLCATFSLGASSQQSMCAADFAEDSERLLAWADADMSPGKSQGCGRVCAVVGSSAGAMRAPTCGGMKYVLSRAAPVNLRPIQTAAQPNRLCDWLNRRLGCTFSCAMPAMAKALQPSPRPNQCSPSRCCPPPSGRSSTSAPLARTGQHNLCLAAVRR